MASTTQLMKIAPSRYKNNPYQTHKDEDIAMKTISGMRKAAALICLALTPVICQAQADFNSPSAQYRYLSHSTVPSGVHTYTAYTGDIRLGVDYLFNDYQSKTYSENLSSSAWGYKSEDLIGIMPIAVGSSKTLDSCPNLNCSWGTSIAANSCVSREVTSSVDVGASVPGFDLSLNGSTSNGAEYCSETTDYEDCTYTGGTSTNKETPVIGIKYRWAVWIVGGNRIYFSPKLRSYVNKTSQTTGQQAKTDAAYALCKQQGMSAGISKGTFKYNISHLGYCEVPNMTLRYQALTQTAEQKEGGCYVTNRSTTITKGVLLPYSYYRYYTQ
jgi:hypothetical protein